MRRILVARTDRIGDVVMITPMIREIRRTYPDCFLAALVTDYTSDILLNNPHLDSIIIDDLSKESYNEVVNEIRSNRFTDGLLTWPMERAAYQMFRGGVKNRIGVGRKLYEVITFMKSVSRNDYKPLRHEADYCMDLARKIGVETNNLTPEIFVTDEEKDNVREFLKSKGLSNTDKKVIVHTGYGNSSPNWSEAKYFDLIEQILKNQRDVRIILTAPEMTNGFLEKINSLNSERIFDLAKDFKSLRDLITTISQCDVLISSSTGPMHIASALGVSTISIFCHNAMCRVARWGALGDKAHNIEVDDEYCNSHCREMISQCEMEKAISTEQILAELAQILN